MPPSLYETISQGNALMSITARKAQEECDNPEKVKVYASELRKTVLSLQKISESQFSPDGKQSYYRLLSEIDNIASQLANECDNPDNVMILTGRMKGPFYQIGEVLHDECPEIRGKSFWETIKERFKK